MSSIDNLAESSNIFAKVAVLSFVLSIRSDFSSRIALNSGNYSFVSVEPISNLNTYCFAGRKLFITSAHRK